MSLAYRIRGAISNGWYNLPPLVGIRLTELLNSGWAKACPAHPLATSLDYVDCRAAQEYLASKKEFPTISYLHEELDIL
jgi:hypothetical protein